MNAVIYARYSSDMQREESIDAQIRACKYYAQRSGIQVIGTYADRAQSGTTIKNRLQFLKMMEDSASGLFDAVLVHKLNRFGRNALDMLEKKRELERNNVQLISVTEKLDSTPEGKLMLHIIAGINEFYSANLAQEVMKGLSENAYQCRHTGGTPPLGYDVGPDKKLVLNENEAQAVRIIFRMYAGGHGYASIIDTLNAQGYRTKRNGKFGKNSIHEILKNEKYIGVYFYNRSASKDSQGKYNRHQFKTDYIRIPGGCPRIIEDELFERVKKMLEHNKKRGAEKKAKQLYILSGKVYCGYCGHKLVGERRAMREREYYYYVCNEAKRKRTCPKSIMIKEYLEDAVLDELNALVFTPEYIENVVKRMLDNYTGNDVSADIQRIDERIKEVSKQIDNLVRAAAKGLDVPETYDMMNQLKADKESLAASKLALQTMPDTRKNADELREYLRHFCNIKNLPLIDQKAVIQQYVDRIIVFDDHPTNTAKIKIILNPNSVEDMSRFESSPPNKADSFDTRVSETISLNLLSKILAGQGVRLFLFLGKFHCTCNSLIVGEKFQRELAYANNSISFRFKSGAEVEIQA